MKNKNILKTKINLSKKLKEMWGFYGNIEKYLFKYGKSNGSETLSLNNFY